MTVTNEERRRVALELREAGKSHDEFDGDMIGRSIYVYLTLIKIACDPKLRMKKGIFDSLADLIEPTPKCSEAAPKMHRLSVHVDGRSVLELDAVRVEVKPDFEIKPHISPYIDLSGFEEVLPKYFITAELPGEIRFREHA